MHFLTLGFNQHRNYIIDEYLEGFSFFWDNVRLTWYNNICEWLNTSEATLTVKVTCSRPVMTQGSSNSSKSGVHSLEIIFHENVQKGIPYFTEIIFWKHVKTVPTTCSRYVIAEGSWSTWKLKTSTTGLSIAVIQINKLSLFLFKKCGDLCSFIAGAIKND